MEPELLSEFLGKVGEEMGEKSGEVMNEGGDGWKEGERASFLDLGVLRVLEIDWDAGVPGKRSLSESESKEKEEVPADFLEGVEKE